MYIYLKTLTPCIILQSSKHLVKINLGGKTKYVKWSELARGVKRGV